MPDANADQRDFWNGRPGLNWVANQDGLDSIHAGAARLLLEECAPEPGERILDVGCGAGATTRALAAAVGPAGQVTGLDISAPLLDRAREQVKDGAGNVAFLLADAATHDFPEAGFDAVTSRFGMMFFDDPAAALRNIAGALRSGGRMVFVTWAGPEANPWFTVTTRAAAARLGEGTATPPDAPGPMAFRDIDRVVGILEAAGLTDCSGAFHEGALHHPGGLEAATELATRVGPAMRLMREREAGEADRQAIIAAIRSEFAPFATADGIRVPAGFNLFRARRP